MTVELDYIYRKKIFLLLAQPRSQADGAAVAPQSQGNEQHEVSVEVICIIFA